MIWYSIPKRTVQIRDKCRGTGCVYSAPRADRKHDAGFTRFRVDAPNIDLLAVLHCFLPENTHLYHIIIMIIYLFTPSYAHHKLVRSNAPPNFRQRCCRTLPADTQAPRDILFCPSNNVIPGFLLFTFKEHLLAINMMALLRLGSAVCISRVPNQ